jgi:DHA2 family multidrug resistance protein
VAAPSGVIAVILTPFAARMLNRYDARILGTVSLFLFALSFYMRSLFTTDASFFVLMVPMLVMGAAMSMFFIAFISIGLSGIPHQGVPAASGLSNFARIITGSFAASLVTTLWERSETQHQTRLAEVMGGPAGLSGPMSDALNQATQFGLTTAQGAGVIVRQISSQAFLLATIDLFRISSIVILLLVPFVWLCRKTLVTGPVTHAAD